MNKTTDVLIETGGIAKRLGVSRSTVRNLERDGKLPQGARLESSGRRVWRLSEVEPILNKFAPKGAERAAIEAA